MTDSSNLVMFPTDIPETHDAENRPHPAVDAIKSMSAAADSLSVCLEADKTDLKGLEATERQLEDQYQKAKKRIDREKEIKREDIQRKARTISEYMVTVSKMDLIHRGLDLDESEVSVIETKTKKVRAKTSRAKKPAPVAQAQ
jgi:hypothetical protein